VVATAIDKAMGGVQNRAHSIIPREQRDHESAADEYDQIDTADALDLLFD
jgi:hypothetical protein